MALGKCLCDETGNLTQAGAEVLGFLRGFCFGEAPTIAYGKDGRVDPYASMQAAGRQEVWHQIAYHLKLDPADLAQVEKAFREQLQERQVA